MNKRIFLGTFVLVIVVIGGYTAMNRGWKTFSSNEVAFQYPDSWMIVDRSYTKNGQVYPLFEITSPERFDIPKYEKDGVYYLVMLSSDSSNLEYKSGIGDFATNDGQRHQSVWNTDISEELKKQTEEYELGQKIISSFQIKNIPSIKVVSPNGGETFNRGEMINIQWESDGRLGDNVFLSLYPYPEGKVRFSSLVPNTGTFLYRILETEAATDFKVSITGEGRAFTDESDSSFSVIP